MAEKQGPRNPLSIDFGLNNLTDAFDRQKNLQSARQEQEQDYQQKQNAATAAKARIADSSAKITNDLLGSFADLQKTLDANKNAAAEQAAKFSSGNPMDAIEAIGNQILDPSTYTRQGRQKKLNEVQQDVNGRVAIAGAQQNALAALSATVDADLAVAGAPLAQAKLNENQGMERIETARLEQAARAQNLATNTQMQQVALMNLDSTQVAALKQKANGQPIDVGGVLIQPGLLQERSDQLDQRQDLINARENALAVSKQEQADKANRKILETYSIPELRGMLQTGDPTGQFKLNDIQQVYGIKQQAASDEIARVAQGLQLGNFMDAVVLPTDDQVKTMQQTVPQGTPLAAEVDSLNFTNNMVAKMIGQYKDAGKEVPIEVMTMANDSIQKAKERVNTQIEKQATLMARGDKDMKELHMERLRGNPLPAATVQSAIQSRLSDNKPLTDILPKDVADDVSRRYREKVQKLKASSMANAAFGTVDKKAIEAQAQSEAINEAAAASVQNRTVNLLTGQLDIPGNPLNGIVSKGAFLDLVAQSDQEGKAALQSRLGLTDEEMTRALNGEVIPGKAESDIRPELALAQNTQLFFKLDTQEAGLAQKYAAWWSLQGDKYIQGQIQQNVLGPGNKDLQSQALESFATPIQAQGSQAYQASVSAAQNYYGQAKEEKYKQMITFGSNPTYRQAVLLQLDKTLTNPEKTQFMTNFILPIVKSVRENSNDSSTLYEETNKAIEQAIDMGVAADPQTQKILNKVVRERPEMNRLLDTTISNPWWDSAFPGVSASTVQSARVINTTKGLDYDWFQNLMKTGGGTQSPNVPAPQGSLLNRLNSAISGITGDFRENVQSTERSLGSPTTGVPAR